MTLDPDPRPPFIAPEEIVPDGLEACIVLLRHGESIDIREGRFQGQRQTSLSELGLRQAALAAERLADTSRPPSLPLPPGPPVVIVHSTLARAAETAAAVAARLTAASPTATAGDLLLVPEPRLAEIAQGEWEGLTHREVATGYPEELAGWRRRPTEIRAPGGESLLAVQARVVAALREHLAALAEGREPGTLDRNHVAGYHDPSVAPEGTPPPWIVFVAHDGIFKIVLCSLLGLPLERFWSFSSDLCGISVLEVRAGRPTLRAFNRTDHLAPIEDERLRAENEEKERSGSL